jgi:hypothetical protein
MSVTVQLEKLIIQLYPIHGVGVKVEARLISSVQVVASLIITNAFHPEEATVQLVKLVAL